MEKGELLVRPSVSVASRSPEMLLSSSVLAEVSPVMVLGSSIGSSFTEITACSGELDFPSQPDTLNSATSPV